MPETLRALFPEIHFMTHQFDEEKATQVATFFASRLGGQINYTKLMKLFYLTDREAFKRWGRPVVGGPYVAMDNGPVSSPAYDAVKPANAARFPLWSSVFRKAGYDLEVLRSIELNAISKAEIEILESIFSQFGSWSQWDLVHYTHVNCGEWHDPQGTSVPIPEETILENVGLEQEQIAVLMDEKKRYRIAHSHFQKA